MAAVTQPDANSKVPGPRGYGTMRRRGGSAPGLQQEPIADMDNINTIHVYGSSIHIYGSRGFHVPR